MRPRRKVSPAALRLLRPLLQYSYTRDAWVLRVVGNRLGPVLVVRETVTQSMEDGPKRRAD